MIKATL